MDRLVAAELAILATTTAAVFQHTEVCGRGWCAFASKASKIRKIGDP